MRRPDELLVRLIPSLPPSVQEVFPKVTFAVVLLTVIHPRLKFEIVVEPISIEPVTKLGPSVIPPPVLLVEVTLVNDPDKAPPLIFKVCPVPFSVTSLTVKVPMLVLHDAWGPVMLCAVVNGVAGGLFAKLLLQGGDRGFGPSQPFGERVRMRLLRPGR